MKRMGRADGSPLSFISLPCVDGLMVKNSASASGTTRRHTPTREGDPMIKIEVTIALKDALEHAVASGTPQVALYKDKPVVILSYDEYERLSETEEDNRI